LTGGAGGNPSELTEYAALSPAHLASAPAGGAGIDRGARLVALAGALLALFQAIYFHFTLCAEDGFFKAEHYVLLNIAAPLGFSGAAPGSIAEEGIEYVAKPAKDVESLKWPVGASVGTNSRRPKTVILGPFIRVGQYLVSFVYLFELGFSIRILVPVRMVLHRFLTKCLSNILVRVGLGYSQNVVIVSVGHVNTPVAIDRRIV
jgi:hypothetical protein